MLLFVVELETLRQDRERLLAGGLSVDYIGILLVAIGFGAQQVILGRYERDDEYSSDFIASLGRALGSQPVDPVGDAARAAGGGHPVAALAISSLVMFRFGFMQISTQSCCRSLPRRS
jgi:DHA2 family multidrug resistance protein